MESKRSVTVIEVEPYWNVNTAYDVDKVVEQLIEVEPYWNVNCFTGNGKARADRLK